MKSRGPQLKRSPILVGLLLLSMSAACSSAPADVATPSDEILPGGTVAPTPADRSSPSEGMDPVGSWCGELKEAGREDSRSAEIYRQGSSLPEESLAAATRILTSGNASSGELRDAASVVDKACQAHGVTLRG